MSTYALHDADAAHYSTSQQCRLSASAHTVPVTYNGSPRNNPDGTYYPGDSFYYVMRFVAGPSCMSFHLGSFSSADGISVDSRSVVYGGGGGSSNSLQQYLPQTDGDDPYVDPDSVSRLHDALDAGCRNNTSQYSACVFGKATVTHVPECEPGSSSSSSSPCTDRTQQIEQDARAVKRVCSKTGDGIKCRIVTITRTGAVAPAILGPDLEPALTLETLVDSDGYDTRNLDGTYYQWDPITVRSVPQLDWKNHRENTVRFDIQKHARLASEAQIRCIRNSCDVTLEHPGMQASDWSLGNGDGLDVYNATDTSLLGLHEIVYDVHAYNNDVLLDYATASVYALVVGYDPVYTQYPYPVLSDDRRTAYENRAGVALRYFGSMADGPDDGPGLHENRRSKINGFYYAGLGYDPWNPVLFNDTLHWSDMHDAGIPDVPNGAAGESPAAIPGGHYDDDGDDDDNPAPCTGGGNGTAMMVRAGYCKIYFDYPILDTVVTPLGPRYENATLYNTLVSDGFAGRKTTYLAHYEYAFPESLFHTILSVRSFGANGTVGATPISVEIRPLMDGQTDTLPEYLYDKVYHDSKDPGFARIVSGDTFATYNQESGTGRVDTKLHRMSVKFETYLNRSETTADLDGLDITELAPEYFGSSGRAKFAVPLSVGLGALSPVSVTVHANGNHSIQYDYPFVDFGTGHDIVLNVAQDNTLDVARGQDVISVTPRPSFGQIHTLYVDGSAVDAPCEYGCTVNVPSDRTVGITAENIWGGRAHGTAPEFVTQQDGGRPPIQDVTRGSLAVLVLFTLSLPILYWMYRKMTGSGQA